MNGTARIYDATGNATAIGAGKEFVYNAANRMSAVKQGGVVAMSYAYNGKGEQVRRYQGATGTTFVYNEVGQLLGEYGATGAPTKHYIWMGDLPVGVIAGNQINYVEPDHLGTPRAVIDPVRNVAVWKWDLASEAFGASPPNADPDGDGIPFVLDLRFPGQRYDSVSELNYNYFRDYESETGRYVESDPIGLGGGISSYAYVESDPINWIDPEGLQSFRPAPRLNRPGGGNSHQRRVWERAQIRAIQNNSHTTPIYTRGLSPVQVSNAETLATIVTGNDYSQYCDTAICRSDSNQCKSGDVVNNWIPSAPSVAQVNAMGCTCVQPFYSGMSPIREPSANPLDWATLMARISDVLRNGK